MNPKTLFFAKMWNSRYSAEEYAYGEEPNAFIKQQLDNLIPGKILFPAEGEGRNAVYAAKLGWNVEAFDLSTEGREKAMSLAAQNGVDISYEVCDALQFQGEDFDALVFCYFHTPSNFEEIYSHLGNQLVEGGHLLFEGFSVKNIGLGSGGPQKEDMCFTTSQIRTLFSSFTSLRVWEEEVVLDEGPFHQGQAIVIRAEGIK